MKESLKNFGRKIGQNLEGFLRTVLEIPPSYEEAYASFEHGKNCSKKENLVSCSIPVAFSGYDPTAMGSMRQVIVEVKFLRCPECHSSVRYSG